MTTYDNGPPPPDWHCDPKPNPCAVKAVKAELVVPPTIVLGEN